MCKFISRHHCWVLNCSEAKTASKMWFEIAGVTDVTSYPLTNQVNMWLSLSGSLNWREWVEVELICIFIEPLILIEARVKSCINFFFLFQGKNTQFGNQTWVLSDKMIDSSGTVNVSCVLLSGLVSVYVLVFVYVIIPVIYSDLLRVYYGLIKDCLDFPFLRRTSYSAGPMCYNN